MSGVFLDSAVLVVALEMFCSACLRMPAADVRSGAWSLHTIHIQSYSLPTPASSFPTLVFIFCLHLPLVHFPAFLLVHLFSLSSSSPWETSTMRARNNREIPDMLQFNPNSYFTCVAYNYRQHWSSSDFNLIAFKKSASPSMDHSISSQPQQQSLEGNRYIHVLMVNVDF